MASPKDERVVLAVDVGGSHVKALVPSVDEPRKFDSGPTLHPQEMVDGVRRITSDWTWTAVSLGIPTPVRGGRAIADPVNLGDGWVGFDFGAAFGAPTRVVNDAVMQAIGSYDGGRMLFLGLGTGLGSALIVDGVVEPLELGHLPFRKRTFEDYVSEGALEKRGKKKWRDAVFEVVERLSAAMEPDYVVLGGGGVDELKELPPNARRGDNTLAFKGGFRLWDDDWPPRAAVGEALAAGSGDAQPEARSDDSVGGTGAGGVAGDVVEERPAVEPEQADGADGADRGSPGDIAEEGNLSEGVA
jgi:polyphosphate glucokinase